MAQTLITKEDAAKLLGVSVARVYQLAGEGALTKLKPQHGRALRFSQAEVTALKQARETFKPVTKSGNAA